MSVQRSLRGLDTIAVCSGGIVTVSGIAPCFPKSPALALAKAVQAGTTRLRPLPTATQNSLQQLSDRYFMVTTRSQGPPEGVGTLPLRSRTFSNVSGGAHKRARTTTDNSPSPKRRRQLGADPAAEADRRSTPETLGPNISAVRQSPTTQPSLPLVEAHEATTTDAEPVGPTTLTNGSRDRSISDLISERPRPKPTLTWHPGESAQRTGIHELPTSQSATNTLPRPPRRYLKRPTEWALARQHHSSPAPRPRSTLEKYRRDTIGRGKRVSRWPGQKTSFIQAR